MELSKSLSLELEDASGEEEGCGLSDLFCDVIRDLSRDDAIRDLMRGLVRDLDRLWAESLGCGTLSGKVEDGVSLCLERGAESRDCVL